MTEWERRRSRRPADKLAAWYDDIAHIRTHNAYHIGQIVPCAKSRIVDRTGGSRPCWVLQGLSRVDLSGLRGWTPAGAAFPFRVRCPSFRRFHIQPSTRFQPSPWSWRLSLLPANPCGGLNGSPDTAFTGRVCRLGPTAARVPSARLCPRFAEAGLKCRRASAAVRPRVSAVDAKGGSVGSHAPLITAADADRPCTR
jgi:hypothetical protein